MQRAGLSFRVIFIPLLILSHFCAGEMFLQNAVGGEIDAQEDAPGGRQDSTWMNLNESGHQSRVIDAKPGVYDAFVRLSPSFPRHVTLQSREPEELSVTGSRERSFPIDLNSFGLSGECCADNHKYLQVTYMVPSPENETDIGVVAKFRRVLAIRPGKVSDVDENVIFLANLNEYFRYLRILNKKDEFKKWRKYSWLDKISEAVHLDNSSSVIIRRSGSGSFFSVSTDIDVSRLSEVRIQLGGCAAGTKLQAMFETAEKSFPVSLILDDKESVAIPIGPIKARAATAYGDNPLRLRKIIGYTDLSVEAVLSCRPLRALEKFAAVDPALRSAALIAVKGSVTDLGAGVRILRVPLESISDRADWGRMLQSLDVVVRPHAGAVNTDILLMDISFVDPKPGDFMPRVSDCSSLPSERPLVRPFTLGPCPVWVRSFNFGGLDPTPLSGTNSDLDALVTASRGVRYRMDRIGLTSVSFSLKGADDWLTVSVLPTALQRLSQPVSVELMFDPALQVTTGDNKIVRPGLFLANSPQDLQFRIAAPNADGSVRLHKFLLRYAGGNVLGGSKADAKVKDFCLSDGALRLCKSGSLENVAVGSDGIVFTGPGVNILRVIINGPVDLPERSAVQVVGDADGTPVRFELEITTADDKVTRRVLAPGEVNPLFSEPTSLKTALLKIIPPEGHFKISLQSVKFLAMPPDKNVSALNVVYTASRNLSLPVDYIAPGGGVNVRAERGSLTFRRTEATSAVDPIVRLDSKSPVSVSELSSLIFEFQSGAYNQSQMTLEIEAKAAGKVRISRYNLSGRDKLIISKGEVLPATLDGNAVPTFVFRLFAENWGKASAFPTVLTFRAVANITRPGREMALLLPILRLGGKDFYLDKSDVDLPQTREYPNWIRLGRVELTGPASVEGGDNPMFRATSILLEPVHSLK